MTQWPTGPALDVAHDARAQARKNRYAARQAQERATARVGRLRRKMEELAERLELMESFSMLHKSVMENCKSHYK